MSAPAANQNEKIDESILAEAKELCRSTEVLPDGALGLARRIQERRRQGKVLRVKLGVDPTAADLHVGHAVVLRKLRRFQEFGHQVVLIIGGFTALIGDPSGRNTTRPQLSNAQVDENAKTYLDQVGAVLDIEKTELVNNAEWLAPLNLQKVLELASKVTVNQLLAKEAFGERLDQQLPVGFHELFYPLLQGYDSVAVRADIELGGTDQRFNLLRGRELQPQYGLDAQLAMLLPLLEGTDGVKKMSKTYDNYIALKDTAQDMVGKCMRIPDSLIVKYMELTTSMNAEEIEKVQKHLSSGGNPKESKEKLGVELATLYHGREAAEQAKDEWNRIHSQRAMPEASSIEEGLLDEPVAVFKALTTFGMAASSGEAKRFVTSDQSVQLDSARLDDPNYVLTKENSDGKVLQVGRRKFRRIKFS